jgi:hypothetical protein
MIVQSFHFFIALKLTPQSRQTSRIAVDIADDVARLETFPSAFETPEIARPDGRQPMCRVGTPSTQ